tara:strand:+ start:295 stop:732 length:438 start_codon:yes stop_codon:yes gene_type:complete
MMNKLKIRAMRKARKSLDITVARLVRLEMQTIEAEKKEEEREKDQKILKSCFEKIRYLFENEDKDSSFEVCRNSDVKGEVSYRLSLSGKLAEARMNNEATDVQCLYSQKCTKYSFSGDQLLVNHLYIDQKQKELEKFLESEGGII